jgi:FAD/FMN-containing dehydrogenase
VTTYDEKKARLRADLDAAAGDLSLGLAKRTSNLFRDRAARRRPRIDLAHFDRVIGVDTAGGTVEAEGMTTFADLADATLVQGAMPRVVPQLRSITLGGAVAGVGIESTSFRHGLVHDTIVEMEILTGDGRIVVAAPDNEHRDLFRGFANSYGTLGYALRLKARTIPVRRYVGLEHRRHADPGAYFAAVARLCDDASIDFLDGVVFAPDALYLTAGRFVDEVPFVSDYTFERIYYRSIRERAQDYLSTRDYLWRWDTDWFWCSKNVGAQNPWLRRLYGRARLNSITYQKIMRWNSRLGLTRAIDRLRGLKAESVIQDVDVPLERAEAFLAFLHAEVGILPIWICPVRVPPGASPAHLYPLAPGETYVNFGFWDVVRSATARPPGAVNRAVERQVRAFGGIKSLYSDAYFDRDEFHAIYGGPLYDALKRRYDPGNALGDLYAKCVERR